MTPDHRTATGAWALITDARRAKQAGTDYGRREYDRPLWFIIAYHLVVKPLGLVLWLGVLIGGLSLAKHCGVAIPGGLIP